MTQNLSGIVDQVNIVRTKMADVAATGRAIDATLEDSDVSSFSEQNLLLGLRRDLWFIFDTTRREAVFVFGCPYLSWHAGLQFVFCHWWFALS